MSEVKTDSVVNVSGDNDSGIDLSTNDVVAIKTANSERARVASDGKVGIGSTSPTAALSVHDSVNQSAILRIKNDSSDGCHNALTIESSTSADKNIGIRFKNQSTEKGGIGYIQSDTVAFYNGTSTSNGIRIFSSGNSSLKANNAGVVSTFENTNTSNPDGIDVAFTGAAPDNNSRYFYRGRDNAVNRYYVYSDGDVQNHDNSYSGTSDSKLKQQVADAASQWDDIKALQVRKFKFNSDVEAHGDSDALWRLGVVAQEVEAAGMNGLVTSSPNYDEDDNELDTVTKAVKYSILYMKAVKALQEAMTRIETLETENSTQATQIADLITRVTALEDA